jgi:hypothetical protein
MAPKWDKMSAAKGKTIPESKSKDVREAEALLTGIITKRWQKLCRMFPLSDSRPPLIRFLEDTEKPDTFYSVLGRYVQPSLEAENNLPSSDGVGYILIEKSRTDQILKISEAISDNKKLLRTHRRDIRYLVMLANEVPMAGSQRAEFIRDTTKKSNENSTFFRDELKKAEKIINELESESESTATHELFHVIHFRNNPKIMTDSIKLEKGRGRAIAILASEGIAHCGQVALSINNRTPPEYMKRLYKNMEVDAIYSITYSGARKEYSLDGESRFEGYNLYRKASVLGQAAAFGMIENDETYARRIGILGSLLREANPESVVRQLLELAKNHLDLRDDRTILEKVMDRFSHFSPRASISAVLGDIRDLVDTPN